MPEQGTKGGEKRQSRRLEVSLPMLVRGADKHGIRFEDTAQSYNISREGASFLTTRELEVGQSLDLIIPGRGYGGRSDFETIGEIRRLIPKDDGQWEVGMLFVGRRLRTFMSEIA